MDINSLLSPSLEAPPSARRASSTSKSSAASSPPLRNPSQPSIYNPVPAAAHVRFHPPPPPAFHDLHRPELAPAAHAHANAMDALAEAASRQRPEASSFHHHRFRSPSSSVSARLSRRPDARPKSNQSPTKLVDLTSSDHAATSLTLGESDKLCRLAEQIHLRRTDFQTYIPYIRMLHEAFVRHRTTHPDPHAFELIAHLRQARDALDNIYPSDEELWIARLGDERSLARSTEDRLAVLKLHALSVRGQPGSVTLWKLYGDYAHYLWSMSYSLIPDVDAWSPEDKHAGKDAFRWDMVVDVWEQASAKTHFHLNNSHLVWDAFTEILLTHLADNVSPSGITDMQRRFEARLMVPHATWDMTFQAFSSFVTTYSNASYEAVMAKAIENSKPAKKMYAERENFEATVQACVNHRDEAAEFSAYSEYITWEKRYGGAAIEWVNALYERMTTRFPTNATLWREYLDTLFQWPLKSVPLTDAAIRATHHCPSSGDLWTVCILAMEEDGCSLEEMERAKHGATMTGLTGEDITEEHLKLYVAWCGYLRRRACAGDSAEEVAEREALTEVGLRAAVEYCESAREKILGEEFKHDPQYRLEQIHISFLTEKGHVDGARKMWEGIAARVGAESYEFWQRYYTWAMEVWAGFAGSKPRDEQKLRAATTILESALHRVDTLDNPEALVDLFLHHCRLRETVRKVHQAVIDAGNVSGRIAERRERERLARDAEPVEMDVVQAPEETTKRKRVDDDSEVGQAAKKGKAEADVEEPKRDREHNVIHMHYLPEDATVADVNRFFRDCGKPRNIRFFKRDDGYTSASVEFDTHQDALYAQTKAAKPFNGNSIEIEFSHDYTIWVANYPPTADEKYLRSLFEEYGAIMEVRLPSLQGNTNRRFCYVEFADESSAHKATELDGKTLDKIYRLQVKISDPSKREDRHGAMSEGREVYVRNVDWQASEQDVKELFSAHGKIEKVRIPRNMLGRSKGVAFVVFETQV
jgi:RNA recognition motif-containing protein